MSGYEHTALDETPENVNFLSPLKFKFIVEKTPILNFYVQNINLPGVHLQQVEGPSPLVKVPHSGDQIQYDDLMINFKVNEDFTNWLEIYNWIQGLGFPKSYDQHAALVRPTVPTGQGKTSDISLVAMDSNSNPKHQFKFRDAFPISLSAIIFDSTRGQEEYADAAVTFRYTLYEYEPVV